MPVVAKRHGVSEQSIYTWKKRFGSFQPDDVALLRTKPALFKFITVHSL